MNLQIYHFEDEPETMGWIPGVLWSRFCEDFVDWVDPIEGYVEDDLTATFTLRPPSGKTTVCYRVYTSKTEFEKDFEPTSDDIALLDIMCSNPNTLELEPTGLDLFKLAVSKISYDRVFVMTAYPATLDETTVPGLLPENIIIKPPDVSALSDKLMAKLLERIRGSESPKSESLRP